MKKKKSNRILLTALLLMVAIFAVVTVWTAMSTYKQKVSDEKITEPDFYAMTEFSAENSKSVMKALKSGNAEKLGELLSDASGAEAVTGFADWSKADFDHADSLGAGSLSLAPDKNGMMDVSERFFVSIEDQKYVLYVETLTSRHGMNNEGVSVVAVTTYENFDSLGYAWNGDKDDNSAVAGKSFLSK